MTPPKASEVSSADKAARHLSVVFETESAGAIETVRIRGSVVVDL